MNANVLLFDFNAEVNNGGCLKAKLGTMCSNCEKFSSCQTFACDLWFELWCACVSYKLIDSYKINQGKTQSGYRLWSAFCTCAIRTSRLCFFNKSKFTNPDQNNIGSKYVDKSNLDFMHTITYKTPD